MERRIIVFPPVARQEQARPMPPAGASMIARSAARLALAILLAFAAASQAAAQDRSPADRQTLVELAYVLGESHALRQACAGAGDFYWRTRMQQMVAAEQPDGPFGRRLADSFND